MTDVDAKLKLRPVEKLRIRLAAEGYKSVPEDSDDGKTHSKVLLVFIVNRFLAF